MSINQLHGKRFEDMIKSCDRFRGAADHRRAPTQAFDIEARFDRADVLPTNIKTTGSSLVCLADARRFFAISETFRMLVGIYTQERTTKVFHEIREYLIDPFNLALLKGNTLLAEVEALHDGLKAFGAGQHAAARVWAREQVAALDAASPGRAIRLNPKIDSKTQRRLQCSVSLEALDALLPAHQVIVHSDAFDVWPLPLRLLSGRRERRRAEA